MAAFKLVSAFKPEGDQPEAIRKLTEGLKAGAGYQALLGVTGSGKTFTMANVIAGQAATIIDNAVLVQQARQRSQRSESLRRIASLVASSATLDEILRFSVQELAQLLRADIAAGAVNEDIDLPEFPADLRSELLNDSLFGEVTPHRQHCGAMGCGDGLRHCFQ